MRIILSIIVFTLVSLSSFQVFADVGMTVEWAPFVTKDGVPDDRLIQAAQNLEDGFLIKQKGYVKRSLLKGPGDNWVDIVYWKSEEDAEKAAVAANESPECFEYFELIEGAEHSEVSNVLHFRVVKSWH